MFWKKEEGQCAGEDSSKRYNSKENEELKSGIVHRLIPLSKGAFNIVTKKSIVIIAGIIKSEGPKSTLQRTALIIPMIAGR